MRVAQQLKMDAKNKSELLKSVIIKELKKTYAVPEAAY